MTGKLMLLLLAAIPLVASPGPATMGVAAVGAAYGARAGLPYFAGIVAGTWSVLLLIATGITGIVLAVPALVSLITVAAAAYILYLAYRIATAPVGGGAMSAARAPAFPGGYLLAIANPKAYAALGAVYAGNTVTEASLLLDTAAKILTLAILILAVNVAWLLFGAAFARYLRHPTIGRAANVVFAVLLVLSVAVAIL
jgi:threonine/homoserine/homoserine lactone efflux protein